MSILLQAFLNEIFSHVCCLYFFGKVNFLVNNFRKILGVSYFKWDSSKQKLISQYSYAPDVNLAIIVLGFNHFWWSIQRRTTFGISHQGRMYCPSKITYLDCILMNQYVFRLDVPVDNIIFMHVLDCNTNFFNILSHIFLFVLLLVEFLIKILAWASFQEEIDKLSICSKGIEINNIRMIQITLNNDLSDQLIETLLIQLALFDRFKAVNGHRHQMPHQIHFTIATLIKKLHYLKHLFLVVNKKSLILFLFVWCKQTFLLLFVRWTKLNYFFGLYNSLNLFCQLLTIVFLLVLYRSWLFGRLKELAGHQIYFLFLIILFYVPQFCFIAW